jgi:hypothetical protein
VAGSSDDFDAAVAEQVVVTVDFVVSVVSSHQVASTNVPGVHDLGTSQATQPW